MAFLTKDEKVFIVSSYYSNEESIGRVSQAWQNEFQSRPPSRSTIFRIIKKFKSKGSVEILKSSGRPITRTGPAPTEAVRTTLHQNPDFPAKKIADALGYSRASVNRILKKNLKMRAYRPTIVFAQKPEDKFSRVAFCQEMLRILERNPDFINKIWYSDESYFNLNGVPNRRNTVKWAANNPGHRIERLQKAQRGLSVWAAISKQGIIGPFFFHDGDDEDDFNPTTVNYERYLAILQGFFWDQWTSQPNWRDNFFMQDGAPPHFAVPVRDWLNTNLDGRWIGRGSPTMVWPPRSPDLTPCDSFLWGYIKNKVFARRPVTLPQLQNYVVDAFNTITEDMLTNVFMGINHTYTTCIESGGLQVV